MAVDEGSHSLIQKIPLEREENDFGAPWPTWRQRKAQICRQCLCFLCLSACFHVVLLLTHSTLSLSCGSFAAVQSLNSLNDQIAQFMVTRPCSLANEDAAFIPGERDTLRKSMTLMRHLLMDAQVQPLPFQQGRGSLGACLPLCSRSFLAKKLQKMFSPEERYYCNEAGMDN